MRLTRQISTLLSLVLIGTSVVSAFADDDNCRNRDSDRLKFKAIPLPPGADFLLGTAANSQGWITGYYRDTPGVLKGFLLQGNKFREVSFPSTSSYTIEASYPFGITRRGVIAGMAYETTGPGHAYTRLGNTVTEIIYPNSQPGSTSIRSVSSDGKILGEAIDGASGVLIPFIFKEGVFTPLSLPPNPPATDIYWASVNSSGHLFGVGNDVSGRVLIIARTNNYKILPVIPGNYFATPVTILDSGDVIVDTANLDLILGSDLGYSWIGHVFRDNKWKKVRSPLDTVGITHLTGGGQISSDDILILGNYYDPALIRFSPFSATYRD
jgi:hypothetical protein